MPGSGPPSGWTAPLEPAEAAWLDEHLAGCADCRAVADAYTADQDALRGLRATAPEPPRDLWARTAAGIEQEAARRGRPLTASGAGRGFRIPVGMLGGITVVAVVLGAPRCPAAGCPARRIQGAGPTAVATRPSQGTVAAAATPMKVGRGRRGLGRDTPATARWRTTPPSTRSAPRATSPIARTWARPSHALDLATAPKTIINAPDRQRAIVVGSDSSGGDKVLVTTQLARPTPTAEADPDRDAQADLDRDRHARRPSAEPDHDAPARTRAPTPATTASTGDREPDPDAPPTATATPTATPTVEPTESATPTPSLTPEPTVATALAIASGVKVVGQAAAFSPDGDWFAFTARSVGRLRRPGRLRVAGRRRRGAGASPPTTARVFSSWQGDRIIASRPDDGGVRDRPTCRP